MMHGTQIVSVVVSLAVLFLIAVHASLGLSCKLKARKSNQYNELKKLYEDEDGIATESTLAKYSVALHRYLVMTGAVLGTLASLTASIISTLDMNEGLFIEGWITSGSWVDDAP